MERTQTVPRIEIPVRKPVLLPGEPSDEQADLAPGFRGGLGLGPSRTARLAAPPLAQRGGGDIALVEQQIHAVHARILNPG